MMRRTEMRSRTSLASAEPRLDVSDLGQLLGDELALQGIDRLCQIFGMMPALDDIFGEPLHACKGLVGLRRWSSARGTALVASLQPRRRHGRDRRRRVGAVDLSHRQRPQRVTSRSKFEGAVLHLAHRPFSYCSDGVGGGVSSSGPPGHRLAADLGP